MSLSPTERRNATLAYIAPFVAFVALLAVERALSLPPLVFYSLRLLIVSLILLLVSRPFLSFRPSVPFSSVGIGVLVFLIWVGPDVLFGYRQHWLFENSVFGAATSSLPPDMRMSVPFALIRTLGSTLLVPVVEELFWRGWLMRWIVNVDFMRVPLGKYTPLAFWVVAVLFASEHGSYWEVGLAAGIVYNWWLVRCRNLADCILAHAVTNGLLSFYVLCGGHWQYWL
jgi:uncharacterized protein